MTLIQKNLNNLPKDYYSTPDGAMNKRLDVIRSTVTEILENNEKYPNQKGQELKILTPRQMLSRLPISLAQLKAGNNSEKL